ERRVARRRPGGNRLQRGFRVDVASAGDPGAGSERRDRRILRIELLRELIDFVVPALEIGALRGLERRNGAAGTLRGGGKRQHADGDDRDKGGGAAVHLLARSRKARPSTLWPVDRN